MTTLDSLLSFSAYPIPMRTIETIALKRGLGLDWDVDADMLASYSYRLAQADLYMWLYGAPNISQGGQSYSLTADQRELWRKKALATYEELNAEPELSVYRNKYGYMGAKL